MNPPLAPARRQFLLHALCGAGLYGLRSLASGIPAAVLAHPERTRADDAGSLTPQFLVLNTSGSGDPLNCNAPGTYLDARILHPADPRLSPVGLDIGGTSYQAAAPWNALSGVLSRTSFIHHRTDTEQHLHEPDVLGLMGNVRDKDMAISAFAAELAPVLGTVQAEPVTLGTADSSEGVAFRGHAQPLLNPLALAQVLASPEGPLAGLEKLRDRDLDRLHALFKTHGNTAQRRFLDDYAQSRAQTRSLSHDLLERLRGITDSGPEAQLEAALVLIQMRVAPVITVHIPFGGDNHFDDTLQKEADETVSGMAALAGFFARLAALSLSDKVTFASLNVFGRTLLKQGAGRSHNRNHHLTLLIGKNVRGSVIGGVAPLGEDYGALPISSSTGRGEEGGDIAREDSLASVGKTLGVALGVPRARVDELVVRPSSGVTAGKVITAALT